MAGKVQAAYLLAPMVMDLVESGVPAKIVSLGHRSGAVIMVRSDFRGENHQGFAWSADRDPKPVSPSITCSCAGCSRSTACIRLTWS